MPNLAHIALQKAVFLRLSGDSALAALVGGVYDRVPQDANFPYVSIDPLKGTDWSTKTTRGMEFEVQVNVWSREGGKKQAATIMEQIFALLHDASFSVENNTLVLSRLAHSTVNVEKDGWTYAGIMQFRMLLENI